VLQPCVSFNHRNTYQWYRERVYRLDADYDPGDFLMAYQTAQAWGDRIPIGVLYRTIRPTYTSQIPALRAGPLVAQGHDPERVATLLTALVP
jgi:2-oxoglutarate ferredoxin oxidoreductase subunit beta